MQKSLHWFPVKVRRTYKLAYLRYHCHSSTATSYVTDMLQKKAPHTRNTSTISHTMPLLNRPTHSKATLGDRSCSFASSSVWNSIPNDVRCACCCCCRPHSTNVLPAESSTRIMWQPTVSPPRWQGKAPLCRDSSRSPG